MKEEFSREKIRLDEMTEEERKAYHDSLPIVVQNTQQRRITNYVDVVATKYIYHKSLSIYAAQKTYYAEMIFNSLGIDFRDSNAFLEYLFDINQTKITNPQYLVNYIGRLSREVRGEMHMICAKNFKTSEKQFLNITTWLGEPRKSPKIHIARDIPISNKYAIQVLSYKRRVYIDGELANKTQVKILGRYMPLEWIDGVFTVYTWNDFNLKTLKNVGNMNIDL